MQRRCRNRAGTGCRQTLPAGFAAGPQTRYHRRPIGVPAGRFEWSRRDAAQRPAQLDTPEAKPGFSRRRADAAVRNIARSQGPSMKGIRARTVVALLIAGLVAAKGLSLLLDPTVRLFMGDSASYLHSAYADWIPEDRSYTYPLFIRLVALPWQSLAPLLLAQSFLGICTALLLFRMLQRAFGVDDHIAALVAIVFAIGPEQLFYERMVMAEAVGLFALASMLACGMEYLRKGNVAWLAGMVLAGCLAISYRLSLLPVVLGFALLPPLVRACARRPWSRRHLLMSLGHLALAAVLTAAAHSAYKSWNGYLSDTKPAYAANAGMLRLGLVLPLVEAQDLDGVGLPPGFLDSLPQGWNDPDAREAALWTENGMIARMREELGDEGMARAARKISIRAVRRDPLALLRLSWQTLGGYFDASRIRHRMNDDLGERAPDAEATRTLQERFNYDATGIAERRTLVHRYFAAAGPWLTACLFGLPLLALTTLAMGWRTRHAAMLLLGLTSLGLFLGHALFSSIVSFRYLHAFSLFVWLNAGAITAWIRRCRSGMLAPVDPELR
jgi:hypothetical protein